ncbi:Hpt domain-containing protein [Aestuariibacter sp. GS-14]|uniref:Hpt domain-containing protein n=1 Tax=Aestuariibacter sp. GS-14 TaxID=2590670 RepID=UPI00112A9968|nr:Hpt domain-containing protein [Aestuariibacter sp. GS-14]TPV61838.1 Hpt domain-containing protein [Aestuariibacter sp. GS-14]
MTTINDPINFEFGLKQLNGNIALLYRLLRKFADEYRDIDTRLTALLEQQDFAGAEILVHTLKGVSGNLGCNAVFDASKIVNQQIKSLESNSDDLTVLFTQVNATVAIIDALPTEGDASGASATPQSDSKAAVKLLMQALTNHEFISTDKLNGWFDAMGATPMQRQQIGSAIDELDYDTAQQYLSALA